MTVEDHKIEVVRRFKYLETIINGSNDETEEIRASILAANKAYSSLQTIFRSKQIHRNNKISLHKILITAILCYGSVTWTLTQTAEQMLNTSERKIHVLRRIEGLPKRFEHLLLWPPRSPDLTPCDFFLWGYVKDNAYEPQTARPHSSCGANH